MKTISTIAKELQHKGQLNQEALARLKKRNARYFIPHALFLLVVAAIWILSGRQEWEAHKDKSIFFLFIAVLFAIDWYEEVRTRAKYVRLYTYGIKVPGTCTGISGGRNTRYSYEFEMSEGRSMSAKMKVIFGRHVLRNKLPLEAGQKIEVLYNAEDPQESTAYIAELAAIYNLKKG